MSRTRAPGTGVKRRSMMIEAPTLGLILAGGLARRMGGGDKPRTSIGGVTILSRVLERLKPQCTRIILNANGDLARFADTGPGRRSSSAIARGPSIRIPPSSSLRTRGRPSGSSQQIAPLTGMLDEAARPRRMTATWRMTSRTSIV